MNVTDNKEKKNGLLILVVGAIIFLAVGILWSRAAEISLGDYKVVYYSARCLLQHGDPYSEKDVLRVYSAEGHERSSESALDREVKTRFFYPPTAFVVTVPFALLGFAAGKLLWVTFCAGIFMLAAVLMYDVASESAPMLAGVLCALLLANSFWLLMIGNSAAIAVGLCVVAAWCFYRNRLVAIGVVCLALSLALKPNDSGLVWLFFLLATPTLRRRALQTIGVLLVMTLPFVVWVTTVSPHWVTELQANMASFSHTAGIVDPGLSGMAGKNMDCIVQLQTAISVLFSDPRTWDAITWTICAPLLLLWAYLTLKSRPSGPAIWIGLAAAAPLTVLPTYHFQHDAKLLMIAIPACAALWSKAGRSAKVGLTLTLGAILVNGDIFSAIRILLTRNIVVPQSTVAGHLATLLFTRPGPIVLLIMAVFYLLRYLSASGELRPSNTRDRSPHAH